MMDKLKSFRKNIHQLLMKDNLFPENMNTKEAIKLRHNRELKTLHFSIWLMIVSIVIIGRKVISDGIVVGWSPLNSFMAFLAIVAFFLLIITSLNLGKLEEKMEEVAEKT